jgi:hypothetical protein
MGVFLMRFATRALQRWFARAFDAALRCAAARFARSGAGSGRCRRAAQRAAEFKALHFYLI